MRNELIGIARQAGRIIEESKQEALDVEYKEDATTVTEVDKKVDRLVHKELASSFPNVPILSEESEPPEGSGTFFCVDPLDGTLELINHMTKDASYYTEYSVHIGYVKDNVPTIGVVYFPATDTLYYAETGGGAYKVKEGTTERIYSRPSNGIVIGRYNIDEDLKQVLAEKYGTDIEHVSTGGSFGAKVCAVAEGIYGTFVHTNYYSEKTHASLWDPCAPDVILWEAGGMSYELLTLKPVRYSLEHIDLNNGYVANANRPSKVLVFDIDNVLGNFEALRSIRDEAHIQTFGQKFDLTEEDARALYWQTKKRLKKEGRPSTCDAFIEVGLTKQDYYDSMNAVPVEGRLIQTPHAPEVMKELYRHYAICALTNTPHKATIDTLRYLDVFWYFDRLYTVDNVEGVKPDPKIYLQIMQDFNCRDCVAIGDQVRKDLEPGKQVGCQTIFFPAEESDDERVDNATTDLRDIPDFIKNNSFCQTD